MNIAEALEKIDIVRNKLLEVQKIASLVNKTLDPDKEDKEWRNKMNEMNPEANVQLHTCWEEIQKSVPAGFSIDGNLVRHLYFNMAFDWSDISNHDVPRELTKIEEYKRQLALVEYLDSLHPEVNRVTEIVLNGDIDAALKTVFASLDSKIRSLLRAVGRESTVSLIGKAFKDGSLVSPQPENTDGARSFLQGVIGYYRSRIIHNPLSQQRNQLNASLSLFAIAHEAFNLFDVCSRTSRSKL